MTAVVILSLSKYDNEYYNYAEHIYAVTKIMNDVNTVEYTLLCSLGYNDILFKNGLAQIQHEHEGCILSRAAMQKIISNDDCIKLFSERAKINNGFTDQCLGCAARIVKIHPVKAPFMASESEPLNQLSLFGGYIAHFHPICMDKNEHAYNLVLKRIEGNKEESYMNLLNKKLFLIKTSDVRGVLCHHITFEKNGSIICHNNNCIEKIWSIAGKKLELLQHDGKITAYFDLEDVLSNNTIHVKGTNVSELHFNFMLCSDLNA